MEELTVNDSEMAPTPPRGWGAFGLKKGQRHSDSGMGGPPGSGVGHESDESGDGPEGQQEGPVGGRSQRTDEAVGDTIAPPPLPPPREAAGCTICCAT